MAVNKLLPFANGVGSNVVDYATWSALTQILGQGFVTGVARSDYANRLFSQGALASYILGQFVVDQTAQDADLNESVFYTNFKNALVSYIKANAVSLDTAQTVGGAKTFTSSPIVPTPASGDNTQKTASTAFVKTAIDNSVSSVKAVSYGSQTLTDAQKTQARTNIGAPKSDLSDVPASKGILVESYRNGKSWYRVYSDGWCEQGGMREGDGTFAKATINLLKAFASADYCIYTGAGVYSSAFALTGNCSVSLATTFGASIDRNTITASSFETQGAYNVFWMACGYIS